MSFQRIGNSNGICAPPPGAYGPPRAAPRDFRWGWTGAAAWGRVEPLGGSRGQAAGQAVVEGGGLSSRATHLLSAYTAYG